MQELSHAIQHMKPNRRSSAIIFWLSAAFVVLAPLSVATSLPYPQLLKICRILVTMMIVAIGLTTLDTRQFGTATKCLLAFAVLMWAGALWSSQPGWGLLNKGLLVFTASSGICFAYSLTDAEDLDRRIRMLGQIAGLAGLVLLYNHWTHPADVVTHGRIAALGMNPNFIGSTAALLLLLALYSALYSGDRRGRVLGGLSVLVLSAATLASGSRGATAMAIAGVVAVASPLARHPGRLIVLGLCVIAFGYIVIDLIGLGGAGRIVEEIERNNRTDMWRHALNRVFENPIIGQGWLNHGTSSASVQNAYLHTAVETGVVGFSILMYLIAMIARQAMHTVRIIRRNRWSPVTSCLAFGVMSAVLLHGFGESSFLFGTTVNAFLLGFGAALVDRIYATAIASERQQVAAEVAMQNPPPGITGSPATGSP